MGLVELDLFLCESHRAETNAPAADRFYLIHCMSHFFHYPITPLLHYSITQLLHYSTAPLVHRSISP